MPTYVVTLLRRVELWTTLTIRAKNEAAAAAKAVQCIEADQFGTVDWTIRDAAIPADWEENESTLEVDGVEEA